MNVKKWGPPSWIVLHSVPMNYQKEQSNIYYNFYQSLGGVLPCKYCRNSYKHFFREAMFKDYLENKRRLSLGIYNIHNMVNKKLRDQGYNRKKDPKFKSIYNRYSRRISDKNITESTFAMLYSITLNYNPGIHSKKSSYSKFFRLFVQVVPGKRFRKLFKQYYMSPDLSSCTSLTKWLYSIQKQIYQEMNLDHPSFRCVYEKYYSWRAKCAKNTCRLKK